VFVSSQNYNFKIEPDKCNFVKHNCLFLDHLITKNGIKPGSKKKKFQAVLKFLIPKDLKGSIGSIGSFFGLYGCLL